MASTSEQGMWRRLLWSWRPESGREARRAVVRNFLLHWFPTRVARRSLDYGYSFYLGTISFALFAILTVTGIVLMCYYVPSVERAYGTMKDIDTVVSFGWFLRRVHRIAAHMMVVSVLLHMVRVFLTGAYTSSTSSVARREVNWIAGVALLVLTLLLSFTGYLLPWDQLAYWATTVGTSIVASIPLVGPPVRYLLVGGSEIGQATLLRFYVLHIAALPLVLLGLAVWHVWRVRKDGGLSATEPALRQAAEAVAAGRAPAAALDDDETSLPSSPHLTTRVLIVVVATVAAASLLALAFPAPLEMRASPQAPPNPAKAPWYFLGLQELVSYSGFVGGAVIPLAVVLGLALIPLVDRERRGVGTWLVDGAGRAWAGCGAAYGLVATCGILALGELVPMRSLFPGVESQLFFDVLNPASLLLALFVLLYWDVRASTGSTRYAALATFCAFAISFALLTYTGTALRGPNWELFWPWQAWPEHPTLF